MQDEDEAGARRPLALSGRMLDIVGALAFLALALWIWHGAAAIQTAPGEAVGPAIFPRAVAILLGATSLLLLVQSVLATRVGAAVAPAVKVDRAGSVAGAIVLVILYAVLLPRLHYYPTTAVFLPCLLFAAGLRRPIPILLCTLGFLLFTKLLFEMVLGTPLP